MSQSLSVLLITAASIGFLHTLFGPDHYLPFVMMSWARKWSWTKTFLITFLCGVGHIIGSVVLGLVGVGLGLAVRRLELIESVRGDLAAWLLISFGLVYFVWGVRRAYKRRPHAHLHSHSADEHSHDHEHFHEHAHVHPDKAASIAPWTLFVIFVLGPCEPLIPILMYPAAKSSVAGMLLVTAVFGAATIATMLTIVLVASFGIKFVPGERLQRYTHALAGATICMCGLAIVFLGL